MEDAKKIFNSKFYFIILAIASLEITSFFGHFFFNLDHLIFILVIALTLILSLKNIKYGVWIVLLELFIGSQGYLLHLDIGSIKISLRIGLWLILTSICLKNYIFSIFNQELRSCSLLLSGKIFKTANFSYFAILFFFVLYGCANGFFQGNTFSNIFFDFNGWLYFLLIFPIYETFFNPAQTEEDKPFLPVWRIFAASVVWLCFKTFLLLFFFSHAFPEGSFLSLLLTHELYQWVRDTLTGEITLMPSGFIRIFIQSQIFVLIALILGLFAASRFWPDIKNNKRIISFFILAGALMLGTILICFSRSFWISALIIFPFYAFWALKKYGRNCFFFVVLMLLGSLIISLGLIFATVKFPIPPPSISFNIAQALSDRAGTINNEAAASSRYALLPELWKQIKSSPVLGKGFGSTVTYHSSDPRVLQQNPAGNYTTYAFEWGWLDIWLKLGFFGLLAYLLLLGKIIKDGYKKNTWLAFGLGSATLLITAVSIFSPYTNHPLGIGFLIIAAAIISKEKNSSCTCP